MFRPLLLFFAEVDEDMIVNMDDSGLRLQCTPASHTHFVDLQVEAAAALAFTPPSREDKAHYDQPLCFPTQKLKPILSPTYYQTIALHLPTPQRDGFELRCRHASGEDKIRLMEKDGNAGIFKPDDTLEDHMTAGVNATEFLNDVNSFSKLGFDAMTFNVVDGTSLTLHCKDESNMVTERDTTYLHVDDFIAFAGGRVTVCASDEEDEEEEEEKKGKKRKKKAGPVGKTVNRQRIARTAWQVHATPKYQPLVVSTKFVHRLCACTDFCSTIMLSSRVLAGVGQIFCISYDLKREGMQMTAYVAPKITDD